MFLVSHFAMLKICATDVNTFANTIGNIWHGHNHHSSSPGYKTSLCAAFTFWCVSKIFPNLYSSKAVLLINIFSHTNNKVNKGITSHMDIILLIINKSQSSLGTAQVFGVILTKTHRN